MLLDCVQPEQEGVNAVAWLGQVDCYDDAGVGNLSVVHGNSNHFRQHSPSTYLIDAHFLVLFFLLLLPELEVQCNSFRHFFLHRVAQELSDQRTLTTAFLSYEQKGLVSFSGRGDDGRGVVTLAYNNTELGALMLLTSLLDLA